MNGIILAWQLGRKAGIHYLFRCHGWRTRLLLLFVLMVWQGGCHAQFLDRDTKPYPDPETYRSSTTSDQAPNQIWSAQNVPDYMAHPQTVDDLHKGYQYLAATEPDVLGRPQFDFNSGQWVGVCHPNHPYRHMRCVSVVCDTSSRYYPRFCQKAAPPLPRYVRKPDSQSDVAKAIRWFTFYETRADQKIKFDSSTGQWLDACDTRHPDYATLCHIPQQLRVYAAHSECIRQLEERYTQQEARRGKPFNFSEFTQAVGATMFLGWFKIAGYQPLPGSGSGGKGCGTLQHMF
jgi:hypothetical protein